MNYETSVEIDAAPDRVWAVVSAVERWPELLDFYNSVEWLDGGSLAVGSRARISQKRMPKLVWTVTEVDAGRVFTWETRSPGVRTSGSHLVADLGDGRARLTLSIAQVGPGAGMAGLMTGRQTRRYVDAEAAGMKRAAEAS